jgi:hypothetical protein
MLVRMWGKRKPQTQLVGIQISTTSMENSMEAHNDCLNATYIFIMAKV